MNSLNSVLLEGNLVRNPEKRFTAHNVSTTTFSVATNRFYKRGEEMVKEVSFFEVETWAGLAERCEDLTKGRGVRIVGRLKQERWVSADGQNRMKVKIVAEHVEFKPQFNRTTDELSEDIVDATTQEEEAEVGDPVPAFGEQE